MRRAARTLVASEHAEQCAVIDWWKLYSAMNGLDERLLFAIPNAQKFMSKARNMHAAYAHAVAEGLREGVPDLMLAMPKMMRGIQPQEVMFHGMFCEMKRKGGKPSAAQLEFTDLLRAQGYNVVIVQGAEEAIRAIKAYLA